MNGNPTSTRYLRQFLLVLDCCAADHATRGRMSRATRSSSAPCLTRWPAVFWLTARSSSRVSESVPCPVPKLPCARAQLVDCRGKFLLPGLIDAHVHLVHLANRSHVTGDQVLPMFLANGSPVCVMRETRLSLSRSSPGPQSSARRTVLECSSPVHSLTRTRHCIATSDTR